MEWWLDDNLVIWIIFEWNEMISNQPKNMILIQKNFHFNNLELCCDWNFEFMSFFLNYKYKISLTDYSFWVGEKRLRVFFYFSFFKASELVILIHLFNYWRFKFTLILILWKKIKKIKNKKDIESYQKLFLLHVIAEICFHLF